MLPIQEKNVPQIVCKTSVLTKGLETIIINIFCFRSNAEVATNPLHPNEVSNFENILRYLSFTSSQKDI